MEYVPEPPLVFSSLIKWGGELGFDVSDEENYQVWNMGVFIALIAPRKDEDKIMRICEKYGMEAYRLGLVEAGERQVVIKPRKIVYKK